MTQSHFRRPLIVAAALLAVLSLAAVAAVMGIAYGGGVAPVWITSTALYGLPIAFLMLAYLVVDGIRRRRRQ